MILLLIAFLAGVLTILSPCILPVLPFIFARADRPFVSNGLPLLISMALVFAIVATLASVVGGWAVAANQYGRILALVLLALFGLTLLFPALAERLMHPLVALGDRLSASTRDASGAERSGVAASLVLGVATGLLWAPCAGPVLGLILSGAALKGASAGTTALLFAYALGSATSLALALLVGGRLFSAMKRSLGFGEWARRLLGAAVLVGVAAIALGADTGLLSRLSLAHTSSLEQRLLDHFHGGAGAAVQIAATAPSGSRGRAGGLPVEGPMPSLDGAVAWLNSPPLTAQGLRGKVVLVDFWTYSCINCLRALPYVKAWAEKHVARTGGHRGTCARVRVREGRGQRPQGRRGPQGRLSRGHRQRLRDLARLRQPVLARALFHRCPGRIRHHHFGEGEYQESEQVIRELLAEAGHAVTPASPVG